jgi:tetratricopeptide (TPR) repeat protein
LIPGGWELWKQSLELDKKSLMRESRSSFEASAKAFFDDARGEKAAIARALLEYSTLMDAFSMVEEGRLLKEESNFEEALTCFAKASEIFRATVHFAFLAAYVSGCASLETASEMTEDDEKFQGYKNAIALFEQSKLALSFRDDRHPLLRSIDANVKFGISRALLVESHMLDRKGAAPDSRKKREQSRNVEADFRRLSGTGETQESHFRIDYFLKGYDCERAIHSSYISSFPERTSLWIGNVGIHSAQISTLGKSAVDRTLAPGDSISWPLVPEFKGKLRIVYTDVEDRSSYDEGCLTVI